METGGLQVADAVSQTLSIISISLRFSTPDSLRNMAWITLVKMFKKKKAEDPYAQARKCLPLNSDIQPFIFWRLKKSHQ